MKVPILLPNIFNYPFTYNSSANLKVGEFVEVPFGKTKIVGVVWDTFEETNNKNYKLKNVIKKFDIPGLKKETVKFLDWFSQYNLIPRGMALKLILLSSQVVEKLPDKDYLNYISIKKKSKFNLSDNQKKNLEEICKDIQKFRVHVLQGVTGSGKTIVYFEAIKKIISNGDQVLILLPEIGLTSQFEKKFTEFFGLKLLYGIQI